MMGSTQGLGNSQGDPRRKLIRGRRTLSGKSNADAGLPLRIRGILVSVSRQIDDIFPGDLRMAGV